MLQEYYLNTYNPQNNNDCYRVSLPVEALQWLIRDIIDINTQEIKLQAFLDLDNARLYYVHDSSISIVKMFLKLRKYSVLTRKEGYYYLTLPNKAFRLLGLEPDDKLILYLVKTDNIRMIYYQKHSS